MMNETPDNESNANGDEVGKEQVLRLVISAMVGEAELETPPILTVEDILARAEADGLSELMVGLPKDFKKALAWRLKSAVGRRFADSQGRAFELGYYICGQGYPIRFVSDPAMSEQPGRARNMDATPMHPLIEANGYKLGKEQVLRLVISAMVGESELETPPILTVEDILARAEAAGLSELIIGFSKDSRKAIGWLLKSLRGRRLIDSEGRIFEFGRRELGGGYPIRFVRDSALSDKPGRARNMDATPMHPLIDAVTKPSATVTPLESWRIDEVKAVGGGNDDLRALCYARIGEEREKLHCFILHFHRHGGTVIQAFEDLADEAVKKGFPERLGCETLSATARFRHLAFPLSNNERPGYVIALRIKRPDLAEMLDAEAAWPLALLRAGWNPWRKEIA